MYMEVATLSGKQGEQVPPAGAWLFPALLLGTMAIQENVQPHCCTKYLRRCSMFHGRSIGSPSFIAKMHPGQHTWVTRKGPSQQGESLFIKSPLMPHRRG
jgi:hypothetical protein